MNNGSKQQIKNIANFMAITVFILLYFAVDYSLYIIQDFFSFVKEVRVRKFLFKLIDKLFFYDIMIAYNKMK